ncbi:hypothetical protein LINGRAHAP2_LOCUS15718 [Linum grandiflorum]
MEPKCMELVAALAAGKSSKLMVEITSSSNSITPLTMALAVAAKQTGGRVIVYIANGSSSKDHQDGDDQLELMDLGDVVDFVHDDGEEEGLVLKKYKEIDFVVVDGEIENHMELLRMLDVNPVGSMVVGHNLNKQGRSKGCSFGEVLTRNIHHNNSKKRGGLNGTGSFVSLPIGVGMELTKIGSSTRLPANVGVPRKYKRFHVTFEN